MHLRWYWSAGTTVVMVADVNAVPLPPDLVPPDLPPEMMWMFKGLGVAGLGTLGLGLAGRFPHTAARVLHTIPGIGKIFIPSTEDPNHQDYLDLREVGDPNDPNRAKLEVCVRLKVSVSIDGRLPVSVRVTTNSDVSLIMRRASQVQVLRVPWSFLSSRLKSLDWLDVPC